MEYFTSAYVGVDGLQYGGNSEGVINVISNGISNQEIPWVI
jgi:hypothetical protein